MTTILRITNLRAQTIIGMLPHELEARQEVVINLELSVDCAKAVVSDDLEDTVNYKIVYYSVLSFLQNSRCHLLEKLGGDIIAFCFDLDARINAVKIEICKPAALPNGVLAGVEMFKRR